MLKVEIALDQAKILKDGKYDYSSIINTVSRAFLDHGLVKKNDNVYTGTGSPNDYAYFWSVIWTLAKKEWFMPYCTKWLWYNSDDGKDENDYSVEDILAFCRNHQIGDIA